MRVIVVSAVAILAFGCEQRGGAPASTPSKPPAKATQAAPDANDAELTEPSSIGPQFWKYDLSEYRITGHDVLYGLGGRWISVRYELKPGKKVEREEIVKRVTDGLLLDGWKKEDLPQQKYVLSRIWETSPDDLCFKRAARGGEPNHWFFTHVVHVSADARVFCAYCEVGW